MKLFIYLSNRISKLSFFKIFLIGILIRLLFYPFTGHWDTISLHLTASRYFQTGILSFYDANNVAIYPPLTFITLAFWQIIIKPFLSTDFNQWLSLSLQSAFFSPFVFRYFFLLKLLYLPFDIGIAYLLSKFGRNEKESKLLTAFWLFNPIVIYVISMWGTIDVIPTFLTLLAVYLIVYKNFIFAFTLLGIGGLYKIWPLLLIPHLCLLNSKKTLNQIKTFLLSVIPFILLIIPYIRITDFRNIVFGSDRVSMLGNAGLYIGFTQQLLIYLLIYLISIYYINRNLKGLKNQIPNVIIFILMVFYATSAYTPQWFLWVMPFITISVIKYPKLFSTFILLFISYILIILTFDAPLSIGLFAPLEPTLLNMPVIKEIVDRTVTDPGKIWSILRTINSSLIIWFLYELYYETKKKL